MSASRGGSKGSRTKKSSTSTTTTTKKQSGRSSKKGSTKTRGNQQETDQTDEEVDVLPPLQSTVYGRGEVSTCFPQWDALVEEMTCWVWNLLVGGFEELSMSEKRKKRCTNIILPLNIGCPNNNRPLLNVSSACALRVYFGKTGLTPQAIAESDTIDMVSYAIGSGTSSVGTVPDMIKSYPIEMDSCLNGLLDNMNLLLKEHPHFKALQNYCQVLNHMEMKLYLGKDIVKKEDVSLYASGFAMSPGADRPMSQVDWHCDFLAGKSKNSQADNSFVLSMSLGDPRVATYKRQITEGGKWKDVLKDAPGGEHRVYHSLEHGSLNILDPRDESGENNSRFKHRVALIRNGPTKCEGTGISVALVFRSCPHKARFHGPASELPFHKVVSEEEKARFNEKSDGTEKKYMGNSGQTGRFYNDCHKIADHLYLSARNTMQYVVKPKIIEHINSSPCWKDGKRSSSTKNKTSMEED